MAEFNPIRAKYNNIEDFKKYFTFKLYFPYDVSEDYKKTWEKSYLSFIEDIEKVYQNGDELWHFDNFDISQLRQFSPMRCCREFIVLKRDGKTVKEFMTRMS